MMELADETDSKSVGLITRAGSTPATGTKIATKKWINKNGEVSQNLTTRFLLPNRFFIRSEIKNDLSKQKSSFCPFPKVLKF